MLFLNNSLVQVICLKKPLNVDKLKKTTATNRKKSENQKINHLNQELINSDNVYTLDDLKVKIKKYNFPSSVLFISEDSSLTNFLIEKPSSRAPTIVFSLVIDSNLTFEMYQEKKLQPLSEVNHNVPSRTKIHTCFEVLKILATLKGLETNFNPDPIKYIDKQVEAILNILSDVEDDIAKSISFLMEQSLLVLKLNRGKHYSPTLLTVASTRENISPDLYKYIFKEGLLKLPTVRYLKDLSSNLNIKPVTELESYKYL
nr:uncharacterized protein LOC121128645 [Lepeophtheirus salmonis]